MPRRQGKGLFLTFFKWFSKQNSSITGFERGFQELQSKIQRWGVSTNMMENLFGEEERRRGDKEKRKGLE